MPRAKRTPLDPTRRRALLDEAWDRLLTRLEGRPDEESRAIAGLLERFLNPWGIGTPIEALGLRLAPLAGKGRTLGEVAEGEDEDAAAAARALIEERTRSEAKARMAAVLNRGELNPSDGDALRRRHATLRESAEASVRGMKLGRGLARKTAVGALAPELDEIVWPLYQLLAHLFVGDRPGRDVDGTVRVPVSATHPTGATRGELYPRPLLQLIALFVSGRHGGVYGLVPEASVKNSVRRLLERHPELEGDLRAIYRAATRKKTSGPGAPVGAPLVDMKRRTARDIAGIVSNDGRGAHRRLLTVEDVMKRTQLKRSAAYALMKRLPGIVYVGRCVRLPESALDEFIAKGGDGWQGETTSTCAARRGGAGSTTTAAAEYGARRDRRIAHWRAKLRDASSASTSKRSTGPSRSRSKKPSR